ncbi:copper chaperone PCu(A)C [Mycobacterium sp. NAZ190054]|uniref:copper chaperone PCu(A)C n=1 Tax=Mycobacterium sp. NAZ190054 TaxID=1747766 RepID=UPI0007924A91|nr:copper chaperone PCu(A)C [Mycobacterium sp. NAZ190054]KWX66760.1 hypothetical protein ASJ79_24175 [Mycobacterium sp. NAZ190054]
MPDTRIRSLFVIAVLAVATACTSGGPDADAAMAASVTVEDPWVRAAESGMTAVFGTLANTGGRPVRIVGAESSSAARVEIHEIARGGSGGTTMRPKVGGIAIAPGHSHALVPGGDHLMLMDLKVPLHPGGDVAVTVVFEDGSALPVHAQIRDFAGGDEEYPGEQGHGHG